MSSVSHLRGACLLPRFLFVLGHQVRGRLAPSWPGCGRVELSGECDGTWVAWRLAGGNHRELARSAAVFPSLAAARDAVGRLRGGLHRAVASTEAVRGLWAWQLLIDDVPVAVASRLYQRPRECGYNLTIALATIPIASVAEEAKLSGRASGDVSLRV
jgi:hypothetical protein